MKIDVDLNELALLQEGLRMIYRDRIEQAQRPGSKARDVAACLNELTTLATKIEMEDF